MDLYFSPLACSMATRIALYEAGADARFIQVDGKTKRTREGSNYLAMNPLGLVPALRTDDGEVLTENAAILQYVAGRSPNAQLAPAAGMERSRLQQWLSFIGTELHKPFFVPQLDRNAPDAVKSYALEKGESRLAYLDKYLAGREYLLERFSIADAYLFTTGASRRRSISRAGRRSRATTPACASGRASPGRSARSARSTPRSRPARRPRRRPREP